MAEEKAVVCSDCREPLNDAAERAAEMCRECIWEQSLN